VSAAETEPRFRDILRIPEIRAAMLGTFVIMLGYGILAPVLPNYARSFGVDYDAVGVLVGAFSFTRLVFDPIVGRLITRYGERAMATIGAAGVGVSTMLAAVAPTYPLLVIFRGAGGAGSAVFFAALLSFLLRTIPSDRVGRVMGVYYTSFNVGIIAGQPFGGVLARLFGITSPLWIYAASCFVSAWMFHRTIRDAPRTGEVRHVSIRRLPWGRPLVAVLAANGAYLWVIGAVFGTLLPLFAHAREGVGLSLAATGGALAVATLTEFAVLFPAGKSTDRRGRRAVLLPGLAGFAIVTAVLGFATTPLSLVLALAALGVGSAYAGVPPAPMLSDITPEGMSGPAVAAFRFVGDVGFVLGPLVAGWAASAYGFATAFAVSALPCAVALVLLLGVRETMPMLPRTGEAAGL
jgi:ACDE family multidrug resistance protein